MAKPAWARQRKAGRKGGGGRRRKGGGFFASLFRIWFGG